MPTNTRMNFCEVTFKLFNIVVLWQFLMNDGDNSSRSFIPKTFSDADLASAPPEQKSAMAAMARGISEDEALSLFRFFQQKFIDALLESVRKRLTYGPVHHAVEAVGVGLYCQSGRAFTQEHTSLMGRVTRIARLHTNR
jgi:hypothetical protein